MNFSLIQVCVPARTVAAAALAVLAASPLANAAPVTATLAASPYGLPATSGSVMGIDMTGDVGTASVTVNPGANAVTITPANGGQIVQGSSPGLYAAPVTGGTVVNPTLYTAPYLSTELGTLTLTFARAQSFLGFLWGSVGTGDQIDFYSGNTDVATFTGTQEMTAAGTFNSTNGSQGFGGSDYTLVNLTGGTFDKVVLSQNVANSFEAAAFEYSAVNQAVPVPEPASMALLGVGILGLGLIRRGTRA